MHMAEELLSSIKHLGIVVQYENQKLAIER